MKKIFFLILLVTVFVNASDLATELLKASDQGRGGFSQGIQWQAQIETYENGKKIIVQGETDFKFYIVKSGKVDIFVNSNYYIFHLPSHGNVEYCVFGIISLSINSTIASVSSAVRPRSTLRSRSGC